MGLRLFGRYNFGGGRQFCLSDFGLGLVRSFAAGGRFGGLQRYRPIRASLGHENILRFRGKSAVTTEGPATDKEPAERAIRGVSIALGEHSNVGNPVQRGHRFQRKADSNPVIADSR